MEILKHLESMWAPKAKRTDKTIPMIKYNTELNIGFLSNDDWFFKVPYAFREALDLKFEERKRNKKSYMVWTQGPILRFKDGDTFYSKNESLALQVQFANPMGWDSSLNEMYLGSVIFKEFKVEGNNLIEIKQYSCNQMNFLNFLVNGVISF